METTAALKIKEAKSQNQIALPTPQFRRMSLFQDLDDALTVHRSTPERVAQAHVAADGTVIWQVRAVQKLSRSHLKPTRMAGEGPPR